MTYRTKSDLTKLRSAEKSNRLGVGVTFSKRGGYYYASGDVVDGTIGSIVKHAFGIRKVAKDIERVSEVTSRYSFRLVDNDELVETYNCLTGKKVMIKAYLKGGCCDPATETFHCM
jgi:predicted Zn-dependent protease